MLLIVLAQLVVLAQGAGDLADRLGRGRGTLHLEVIHEGLNGRVVKPLSRFARLGAADDFWRGYLAARRVTVYCRAETRVHLDSLAIRDL